MSHSRLYDLNWINGEVILNVNIIIHYYISVPVLAIYLSIHFNTDVLNCIAFWPTSSKSSYGLVPLVCIHYVFFNYYNILVSLIMFWLDIKINKSKLRVILILNNIRHNMFMCRIFILIRITHTVHVV